MLSRSASSLRIGSASRPRAIDGDHVVAAAADDVRVDAADLRELAAALGLALGELDHRRVAQHRADRPVLLGGRALAPGRQLARDRALAWIEPGDARQPPPDLVRVALVGRVGDRAALLARPLQPAALLEPAADLVGERHQVLDVAARVAQLLVGQRPRVPAREARRLREADPQDVVQQPVVAGLRGGAGESGGDLRVEDIGEVDRPLAAQDRHVLAAGVHDDLDRGIGEHGGERRGIEPFQRVEHVDLLAGRDLHEAEQRPVPPLGHELGVETEPPSGSRALRDGADVRLPASLHAATLPMDPRATAYGLPRRSGPGSRSARADRGRSRPARASARSRATRASRSSPTPPCRGCRRR